MLDKLLIPLVGWIPGGWKTATGLTVMALLQVASAAGWISPETADQYYKWAELLFGVGVFHAVKGK